MVKANRQEKENSSGTSDSHLQLTKYYAAASKRVKGFGEALKTTRGGN